MFSLDDIKQLRQLTGAPISDCRQALEKTNGDIDKALDYLKSQGLEKAAKKADRQTGAGVVDAYIHSGNKVGALVEIRCETDFVARTDEFKNFVHEVAMQVAAMKPKSIAELVDQESIRDPKETISAMLKLTVAKLGENIRITNISWFAI